MEPRKARVAGVVLVMIWGDSTGAALTGKSFRPGRGQRARHSSGDFSRNLGDPLRSAEGWYRCMKEDGVFRDDVVGVSVLPRSSAGPGMVGFV